MAEGTSAAGGKLSAVDQVVDQIRALIRDGGLAVGDALPSEVDLAARVGASRNTVREAIRILKAFGVVESRQKVGAVITDRRHAAVMDIFSFAIDLSADSFRDVQGFRRLVETNLFDRVRPALTDELVAGLAASVDRQAALSDPVEAAREDHAFHMALVRAARNRTLIEIYEMLAPVMMRVMETGKTLRTGRASTAAEHGAILDALVSGDRVAYAYHVSRHLDAGLEFLPAAAAGADPRGRVSGARQTRGAA